jgi:large repetitive protein
LVAAVAALFVMPANGLALTVNQASLSGGRLHVSGTGAQPGVFVTAESFGSSAGIRSDTNGSFTIDKSGFVSEDCTVVVWDGSTPTAVPTLAGCTPVAPKPVSSTLPAPSGSCVITPPASTPSFHLGDSHTAVFFATTGCTGPVTWSLVAGRAPRGLHLSLQGQTGGGLIGTPVSQGTSTFTIKVTDQGGRTDYENFSATITAPLPVTIAQTTIPNAVVGSSYQVNFRASGGLAGYLWSVGGGTLPPGLRLSRGILAGSPTTRGTFTFSIRAVDSLGAVGTRTYTVTIS